MQTLYHIITKKASSTESNPYPANSLAGLSAISPRSYTSPAFTIIELIVVIAIIAILATISILGYGAWQRDLAEDVLKSDLAMVVSQLKMCSPSRLQR